MNSIIDGSQVGNYSTGASVALLSIVMVFLILLLIIIICELAGKAIEKASANESKVEETSTVTNRVINALDLNDEDATVACLIASIDMRNEIKKNVKVISVRRIG